MEWLQNALGFGGAAADPVPNENGLYPASAVSFKRQLHTAIVRIRIGVEFLKLTRDRDRAELIPAYEPQKATSFTIRYLSDTNETQFRIYPLGDKYPLNHGTRGDKLVWNDRSDNDNPNTWFSLVTAGEEQVGLRAYDQAWRDGRDPRFCAWNFDDSAVICHYGEQPAPQFRPVFMIVKPSEFVKEWRAPNRLLYCAHADTLNETQKLVRDERKLIPAKQTCDDYMMQFCKENPYEPECICITKDLELQKHPIRQQHPELNVPVLCTSTCYLSTAYRSNGMYESAKGGCGPACVQIQSISDQASVKDISQVLDCSGRKPDGGGGACDEKKGTGCGAHGSCVAGKCQCRDGYSGTFCETLKPKPGPPKPWWQETGNQLLILTVVLLVGGLLWARNRSNDKENES